MTGHNYRYIKKEDIRSYLLIASVVILLTHNILKDILFGIPIIHLGNLISFVLFVTIFERSLILGNQLFSSFKKYILTFAPSAFGIE